MEGDNGFAAITTYFNTAKSVNDHSTSSFSQETVSCSQGTSNSGNTTEFDDNNNGENVTLSIPDFTEELIDLQRIIELEQELHVLRQSNVSHTYCNNEVAPSLVHGENKETCVDQNLIPENNAQAHPTWEQPLPELMDLDFLSVPVHQPPQEITWKVFNEDNNNFCAGPSSAISTSIQLGPPPPLLLPIAPRRSDDLKRFERYFCDTCERDFTSSGHLKRHYNTAVHNNVVKRRGIVDLAGVYQPIDNNTHAVNRLPSLASLKGTAPAREAVDSSTTGNVLKCVECPKTFKKACYLTQHFKSVHSGEKPFRCPKCGKRYSDEIEQLVHTLKHSGTKPHQCPQCPKMFHHKPDLKRHLSAHTDVLPHVCETCGKGFVRNDHMLQHAEKHKRRPFDQ